jgi:hypothetical protein
MDESDKDKAELLKQIGKFKEKLLAVSIQLSSPDSIDYDKNMVILRQLNLELIEKEKVLSMMKNKRMRKDTNNTDESTNDDIIPKQKRTMSS